MVGTINQSFTEVYDIVKHLDSSLSLELLYPLYIDTIYSQKKKDKLELKQYEEELKEKYNIENIFKSRKQEQTIQQIQLVENKQSIFKRIINKILSFFIKK